MNEATKNDRLNLKPGTLILSRTNHLGAQGTYLVLSEAWQNGGAENATYDSETYQCLDVLDNKRFDFHIHYFSADKGNDFDEFFIYMVPGE